MKFKPEIELDFTRQHQASAKALRAELPAMVEKLSALVKDGAVVKETAYLHAWLSRGISDAEAFIAARAAKAAAKAAKKAAPKAAKATASAKAPKPSRQIGPRESVDAGVSAVSMF